MKTKKFTFMIASLFALVFLLAGLASATLTISNVPALDQEGSSFTFDIASTENETVSFSFTDITYAGKTITFTEPADVNLNTIDGSQTVTVNYVVESGFDFDFGQVFKTTLTANGTVSDEKTQVFTFEESSFCAYSNPGDLRVKVSDVKVTKGFGDDEWFRMDEVELEFTIENRGDDDIDNVVVEWGLYSEETDEWVLEIDDLSDFNLKDGDEEVKTVTFSINNKMDVDLEDLQDGSYTIYVKAT